MRAYRLAGGKAYRRAGMGQLGAKLNAFDALLTEPDEAGDVYFITEEDDTDYYIKLETEAL